MTDIVTSSISLETKYDFATPYANSYKSNVAERVARGYKLHVALCQDDFLKLVSLIDPQFAHNGVARASKHALARAIHEIGDFELAKWIDGRPFIEIGANLCTFAENVTAGSHACLLINDGREYKRLQRSLHHFNRDPLALRNKHCYLASDQDALRQYRQSLCDAFRGVSSSQFCLHGAQSCRVKADYAIASHSLYDIGFRDLGIIFQQHDIRQMRAIMHIPRELCRLRHFNNHRYGYTYDADASISEIRDGTANGGYCHFYFNNDPSHSYRHDIETWMAYYVCNGFETPFGFNVIIEVSHNVGSQFEMHLDRVPCTVDALVSMRPTGLEEYAIVPDMVEYAKRSYVGPVPTMYIEKHQYVVGLNYATGRIGKCDYGDQIAYNRAQSFTITIGAYRAVQRWVGLDSAADVLSRVSVSQLVVASVYNHIALHVVGKCLARLGDASRTVHGRHPFVHSLLLRIRSWLPKCFNRWIDALIYAWNLAMAHRPVDILFGADANESIATAAVEYCNDLYVSTNLGAPFEPIGLPATPPKSRPCDDRLPIAANFGGGAVQPAGGSSSPAPSIRLRRKPRGKNCRAGGSGSDSGSQCEDSEQQTSTGDGSGDETDLETGSDDSEPREDTDDNDHDGQRPSTSGVGGIVPTTPAQAAGYSTLTEACAAGIFEGYSLHKADILAACRIHLSGWTYNAYNATELAIASQGGASAYPGHKVILFCNTWVTGKGTSRHWVVCFYSPPVGDSSKGIGHLHWFDPRGEEPSEEWVELLKEHFGSIYTTFSNECIQEAGTQDCGVICLRECIQYAHDADSGKTHIPLHAKPTAGQLRSWRTAYANVTNYSGSGGGDESKDRTLSKSGRDRQAGRKLKKIFDLPSDFQECTEVPNFPTTTDDREWNAFFTDFTTIRIGQGGGTLERVCQEAARKLTEDTTHTTINDLISRSTAVCGPPGCGKSRIIFETALSYQKAKKTFPGVLVVPTSELAESYRKGIRGIPVLTTHNAIIRIANSNFETIVIDEAFMYPIGYLMWMAAHCESLLLLGDPHQIGHIDFTETQLYQGCEKVKDYAQYIGTHRINTTHRCPQDITSMLQPVYGGIKSTSKYLGSIVSATEVPRGAFNVLTYGKVDKASYASYGAMTVHEAQGRTFDNVALVLTDNARQLLRTSPAHTIVAITRHRKQLVLVNSDGDSVQLITDALMGKLVDRNAIPLFTTNSTRGSHHTNSTFSPLHQTPPPVPVEASVEGVADVLQTLIPTTAPPDEVCNAYIDTSMPGVGHGLIKLSPQIIADSGTLKLENRTARKFYVARRTKNTFTGDKYSTVVGLLGRYLKQTRNLNTERELLAEVDRLFEVFSTIVDVDNFTITAELLVHHYTAALTKYQASGNNIDDIDIPDLHTPNGWKNVSFHMKAQSKVNKSENGAFNDKYPQGISAWSKKMNFIYMAYIRALEQMLCVSVKQPFHFATGSSQEDILNRIDQARVACNGQAVFLECDYTEFDSSMNNVEHVFSAAVMRVAGVPEEFIEFFLRYRAEWTLIARGAAKVIGHNKKHSGEPGTLLFNTLFCITVTMSLLDIDGLAYAGFKGDDSLIIAIDIRLREKRQKFISDICGWTTKLSVGRYAEFISFIVNNNGVSIDFVRLACKLTGKIFLDPKGYLKYQQAVADWLSPIKTGHTFHRMTATAALHYNSSQAAMEYLYAFLVSFSRGDISYDALGHTKLRIGIYDSRDHKDLLAYLVRPGEESITVLNDTPAPVLNYQKMKSAGKLARYQYIIPTLQRVAMSRYPHAYALTAKYSRLVCQAASDLCESVNSGAKHMQAVFPVQTDQGDDCFNRPPSVSAIYDWRGGQPEGSKQLCFPYSSQNGATQACQEYENSQRIRAPFY
jgi:hypothetical protein